LFNYKEILYTYKLERNNNNWTVKREQISTIEEKEYAIVDDMSATRKSYNNTISRIQEITHYTKDIELYTAININL
jgi:orotate phosphoribosyltransferase-like protein